MLLEAEELIPGAEQAAKERRYLEAMCPEVLEAEEARIVAEEEAAVGNRARELLALHMGGAQVAADVTVGPLALEVMRLSLQVILATANDSCPPAVEDNATTGLHQPAAVPLPHGENTTHSNASESSIHWGFSERGPLKLGDGPRRGLQGLGKRALQLVQELSWRRVLGPEAVGLGMAALVEKAFSRADVRQVFPRAQDALALATGAFAAARAIALQPVSSMLEAVASAEQRDEFVDVCLSALRSR